MVPPPHATVTTTGTTSGVSSFSTKCEKIKNPTFSGDIHTYMKFKKDFKEIVEPNYQGAQLSYVLRESCLQGQAKALVQNIDKVEDIWEKLKDRYGDTMHLVEVVIRELNELPVMKGSDDRKFIAMVDLLEKGLQDLEAIDARAEIANQYTVKLIEGKLNRMIYLNWLKEEETTDGATKFEKLFTYLKAERKRVEKLVQRGESNSKPNDIPDKRGGSQERTNHAYGSQSGSGFGRKGGQFAGGGGQQGNQSGDQQIKDNCLIHPKVAHFTRKCREFLAKTSKERAEIVKAAGACILCLSTSHVNKPCPFSTKWKPCDVDSCGALHSRLVHEAIIQGFTMHITAKKNHTLLLMQMIPTKIGEMIFAFFDNGSTITLVSTSFVKRNKLKGIRVTYELITVGN